MNVFSFAAYGCGRAYRRFGTMVFGLENLMITKYVKYSLLALFVAVISFSTAKAVDGAPLKGKTLAFTIQDLSNPIWAQYAKALVEMAESHGMRGTALDCKANAATQITQVENFIQEGIDAMIIHPAEANALEAVVGEAHAKGMKIVSWDILMQNADAGYLIDNYSAGKIIGGEAAKWINEKLGGEADVALLEYPVYPELVMRANGIVDGLKEGAPNAKIVAKASAINATEGMAKTETVLMANPGIKVIVCIGDGGAIGANEVVKSAGKDSDDFGIFSCDATEEAMSKIKNGEPIRMSVSFGTPDVTADELLTLVSDLLAGKEVKKEFFRNPTPVSADNVGKYYTK